MTDSNEPEQDVLVKVFFTFQGTPTPKDIQAALLSAFVAAGEQWSTPDDYAETLTFNTNAPLMRTSGNLLYAGQGVIEI